MKTLLLTFGGGGEWPKAANRLKSQAVSTGLFDHVVAETSDLLFSRYPHFEVHRAFIESNKKGYGYWLWKPLLVLEYMKHKDGYDSVFYLDAGCEILPQNKDTIKTMLEHLGRLGHVLFGYAGFPSFNLPFWTKQSLLDILQSEYKLENYLGVPTVWAGGFGLMKTPRNISLVENWINLAVRDNYTLLDDTPSKTAQIYPYFGHRHDQAIFSALVHLQQYSFYKSASEFDYIDIAPDKFESLFKEPILGRRLINSDTRSSWRPV